MMPAPGVYPSRENKVVGGGNAAIVADKAAVKADAGVGADVADTSVGAKAEPVVGRGSHVLVVIKGLGIRVGIVAGVEPAGVDGPVRGHGQPGEELVKVVAQGVVVDPDGIAPILASVGGARK